MTGRLRGADPPDIRADDLDATTWASLLHDGPLGLAVTDDTGVFVWLNGTLEQMLGHPATGLVGQRTFQDLLAPGGRIYFDTHLRPLLHVRHEANEIALEVVRSDDTRLSVLVNFRYRTPPGATRSHIEIVVFDATNRRSYETELLHAQRDAQQSEARLQVMYDIASGLAAAITIDDILHVVARQGESAVNGARCSVWLFGDGGRSVERLAQPGDETLGPTLIAIPEQSPAVQQLTAGHLVVIADHAASQHEYPLICGFMEQAGVRSAAVAPLHSAGSLVGALSYGFEEAHEFESAELQAASALATLTEEALQRARLVSSELRHKRRLEVLLDFTTRLSGAHSLEAVLDVIVESSHELLGAVGVRLALVDEAERHLEFVRGTGLGGRLGLKIPIEYRSIACTAFRTGVIQVATSRQEVQERFPDSPILSDPDFGRCITVPLRRGDEVLGAWVLAFAEPGAPDVEDVTLVELFGEQAAQATQRAKLHTSEVAARQQADVRRAISEALNRSPTMADVADAITREGRAAFDAAGLAVFVVDAGDPSVLRLQTAVGLDRSTLAGAVGIHEVKQRCDLSTWRSARFLTGRDEVKEIVGVLTDECRWTSAAVLPLGLAGVELGVVLVGFDHPDALSSATRSALSGLAGEASIALARARRFDVEHEIALTLQRSILPVVDVAPAGWTVSTWYQPTTDMVVGGDLFELTELEGGRLSVIVGDVVGHGLQAAAAMGALRSAAKALALVSAGPSQVVAGLNDFAAATPGVLCSSVCCVEVRPDGSARYASAGHPAPVLRHPDGRTELLDGGRSAPLGVGRRVAAHAEFVMVHGSTLVMYTDGLIERRDVDIDTQTMRLRDYVRVAFPGATAQETVDHMLAGRRNGDDAVVVCLTRVQ